MTPLPKRTLEWKQNARNETGNSFQQNRMNSCLLKTTDKTKVNVWKLRGMLI